MANYEKPTIVKVGNPLYNKNGSVSQAYPYIRKEIEGSSIAKLVEEYGSPLFVFSEKTMREKYKELHSAIQSHYGKVQFGWSYKTNYLAEVCKVFHSEGACAEVVSDFEYDKARGLGVPGNQIIYNGPYKTFESLEKAVMEEAQIHIDNFAEIGILEEICQKVQKKAHVGIRLNMNVGIYPQWSRFGFNLESGQACTAIERLQRCKWLSMEGVHTHIGTFILDATAYEKAATKLVRFMEEIEGMLGMEMKFIDLGGGFASLSQLRGVYQPPEIAVPQVKDYARNLCGPLLPLLKRKDPPTLILENGRHLIDEAGFLISSVVGDKLLADGRRSYIVDAGVNLLYTSTWYKFKLELATETSGVMEPSMINGPLCMNIDVIDEGVLLPRLTLGQQLILSPVGAYNVTQWMQFIRLRPAVVMIDCNGKPRVIRKAESVADVEALEVRSTQNEILQKKDHLKKVA